MDFVVLWPNCTGVTLLKFTQPFPHTDPIFPSQCKEVARMQYRSLETSALQRSVQSICLQPNLLLLLSPKSRERINCQEGCRAPSCQAKATPVKLPYLRKAEQTRGNILRWKFAHISCSPPRRIPNPITTLHKRTNSEKYPLVLPRVAPQGADYLLQSRLLHESLCKSRRLRMSSRLSENVTCLPR